MIKSLICKLFTYLVVTLSLVRWVYDEKEEDQ